MSITIHLTKEEQKLVENYANQHKISVEEAMKTALFEHIENEYDSLIAHEAYKDFQKDGQTSRPVGELW